MTGTGANVITLSGGNATRLFNVLANVKAAINFLTMANGNGDSATNSGIGGAILISGAGSELTLDNVTLQNNSTSGNNTGGAIDVFTSGNLIITNSIVRHNMATNSGGRIIVVGTAQITNVTFSDNTSN